ncbi:MAG: YggS family pyridoxal phosphate-dependent enzyme [Nitrospirales bacterium]|nr:YggS family pyridoxal phosphate-dependent enzyme [Nitrospirales bacterium]
MVRQTACQMEAGLVVEDATHDVRIQTIAGNVRQVLETIQQTTQRVGREAETVRLVAATKQMAAESVRRAYQAGIRFCGENRLQEAQTKMADLGDCPELAWHFIGRVQRRKIKSLVGRFVLIHSVESVEQAVEIDGRACEAGIIQSVLLEVNVGQEASKGGFSPADVLAALPVLDPMPHLQIQGLMMLPPWTPNPENARPYFRQLRKLAQDIKRMRLEHVRMNELSMGMTHDYPIAIEEGATIVRVGTGIFGPR